MVRTDLPAHVKATISVLEDSIDNVQMQELNSRVTFGWSSYQRVAQQLLAQQGICAMGDVDRTRMWQSLRHNTAIHLKLTGIALAVSIALGVLV